jgi:predicted metal-dependent HD superfamily phosphohydrolase
MSEYAGDEAIGVLFRNHTTVPKLLENTPLTALFLDLDLSILGATEEEYDPYSRHIRSEYCQFTEEEYNKGRTAVMKAFLERERLYFTPHFYAKYESIARRNIQNEIDSLHKMSKSISEHSM